MLDDTFIDIQFKGQTLRPRALSAAIGMSIESLIESGELGKIGRYKGQPSPYGIGLLKVKPSTSELEKVVQNLADQLSLLATYGVEEIVIDVDTNIENLEKLHFSNKLMKYCAALNARIQFNRHNDEIQNVDVFTHKLLSNLKETSLANQDEVRNVIVSYKKEFSQSALTAENMYTLIMSLIEGKPISKDYARKKLKEFGKAN